MFCRFLFVLLSVFFLAIVYSLFDLRLLIIPLVFFGLLDFFDLRILIENLDISKIFFITWTNVSVCHKSSGDNG